MQNNVYKIDTFKVPFCSIVASVCVAVSLSMISGSMLSSVAADEDAFSKNRWLGRGINLGNALEVPREGEGGFILKSEYFQVIKDAGFNSVRIPINWSAHALRSFPYTIDAAFFRRVDWAISQALMRNLTTVINVHNYEEMNQNPADQSARLTAIWRQIASRYSNQSPKLFFEIFNEPHDKLTDEAWNQVYPDLLKVIRQTNANRTVIIGPAYYNEPHHLPRLLLPQNDRRLIVTFHYYAPFHFTHQGASWVANSAAWKGTEWGTNQEMDAVHRDFTEIAAWADENRRPMYLGEFGAFSEADMRSRAAWTRVVSREAERFGFSWAYWEFCFGFGAYDRKAGAWRSPLLAALLDR